MTNALNRRTLASAALAAALSACATWPSAAPDRRLTRPPRLREGATVGLIAPGGVLNDAIVAKCVANLERLGFRVKLGANVLARWGGYAGTIEQRVDDLHTMFADTDVRAIWSARGGSGCAGLLPHIDYSHIRSHPKILVGYSDITALHLALYAKAQLVSFHGPVAWSTPSAYSVANMRAALMGAQTTHTMSHASDNLARAASEPQFQPRTHRAGRRRGPLVGGNLSVLAALVGTPYAAPLRDHLLFLEEIDEAPYRIDRLLHQLSQSHAPGEVAFNNTSAVVLGVLNRCEPKPGGHSLSLAEVLGHHLNSLRVPAVSGYSFGHIANQMTLPIGVMAELDTESQTLTQLESATEPD